MRALTGQLGERWRAKGGEKGRRRLRCRHPPAEEEGDEVCWEKTLALIAAFIGSHGGHLPTFSQRGEGVGGSSASRRSGKPFPRSEIEVWRLL